MDESCALARKTGHSTDRWRARHRFRRLRNRGGPWRLPVVGRARQAVAPTAEDGRSRARRRRDQFVSGYVRAPGRELMVPDVTIPRPFAGTRPVIRRLAVFAAAGTRESWAVTGRFREKFWVAYTPSHRV